MVPFSFNNAVPGIFKTADLPFGNIERNRVTVCSCQMPVYIITQVKAIMIES
jgi:hypothetical protein